MRNLALFTIKNDSFIIKKLNENYGLSSNTFTVDITQTLNSSKSVKFTEYPLLDTTTRINSVSKSPGTLSFQGKIGEVLFNTQSSDTVKAGLDPDDSRMRRFVQLLEFLRDNAYVLDIDTESKKFENYVIESVSFTTSTFGIVDVNFTLKEFIAFGQKINIDEMLSDPNTVAEVNLFYLNNLTIDNFTTDKEMFNSIYKLLTNSYISQSFMIKMASGFVGFTPDVKLKSISAFRANYLIMDTWDGSETSQGLRIYTRERTFIPVHVESPIGPSIYTSNPIYGDKKLKLSVPAIQINNPLSSLVYDEGINTRDTWTRIDRTWNYRPDKYIETPKYQIAGEIFDGDTSKSFNIKDFFLTPKYSEISGGVNPIKYISNDFNNDAIVYNPDYTDYYKEALCFIKKTKNPNVYEMSPNLLANSSLGYLYGFKYMRNRSYEYGFIYFHPDLLYKVYQLINIFNITPNNLLYGKTINWG